MTGVGLSVTNTAVVFQHFCSCKQHYCRVPTFPTTFHTIKFAVCMLFCNQHYRRFLTLLTTLNIINSALQITNSPVVFAMFSTTFHTNNSALIMLIYNQRSCRFLTFLTTLNIITVPCVCLFVTYTPIVFQRFPPLCTLPTVASVC